MSQETKIFVILFVLLFLFDWIFDGIDFKSFLLGVGSTILAANVENILKWKK